jgi:hypothetical protein
MKVPILDQRAELAAIPGVQQSISYAPIEQGISQFGAGLTKAVSGVAQLAATVSHENDVAASTAAYSDWLKKRNAAIEGTGGYLNKQGRDAIDGASKTLEFVRTQAAGIEGNLYNDAQRAMFRERIQGHLMETESLVNRHVVSQSGVIKRASEEAAKGELASSATAAAVRGDVEASISSVQKGIEVVEQETSHLDSESRQRARVMYNTSTVLPAIEAALDQGTPTGLATAKQLLAAYRNNVDSNALVRSGIEARMEKVARSGEVLVQANKIFNDNVDTKQKGVWDAAKMMEQVANEPDPVKQDMIRDAITKRISQEERAWDSSDQMRVDELSSQILSKEFGTLQSMRGDKSYDAMSARGRRRADEKWTSWYRAEHGTSRERQQQKDEDRIALNNFRSLEAEEQVSVDIGSDRRFDNVSPVGKSYLGLYQANAKKLSRGTLAEIRRNAEVWADEAMVDPNKKTSESEARRTWIGNAMEYAVAYTSRLGVSSLPPDEVAKLKAELSAQRAKETFANKVRRATGMDEKTAPAGTMRGGVKYTPDTSPAQGVGFVKMRGPDPKDKGKTLTRNIQNTEEKINAARAAGWEIVK